MSNTRRDFLEQTSVAATTASAAWLFVSEAHGDDKPSDAERLSVAVIGPGGMGMAHTNQLAGNNSVAKLSSVLLSKLTTIEFPAILLSRNTPPPEIIDPLMYCVTGTGW